jgi:hypothetical protein
MSETPTTPASPPWGTSLKLVIGLTFVAIAAGLLIGFYFGLPAASGGEFYESGAAHLLASCS